MSDTTIRSHERDVATTERKARERLDEARLVVVLGAQSLIDALDIGGWEDKATTRALGDLRKRVAKARETEAAWLVAVDALAGPVTT